ncbi:PerC family transcriptional regulator [Shigella sonnei]|nr:PerC family transcriptional regulator [Shigella sonnei]
MMEVKDKLAEKLESLDLWRRAAHRWLDVMMRADLCAQQREWIRKRRSLCISRFDYRR